MATLDLVVVAIVLLCGLITFALGFVRVVLGLAGWGGAALITLYAFPYVRPVAQHWIDNALLADVAAIGGIFIVALIILSLISHALSRLVRNSALSILDRTLGLAFGLALGVAAMCLAWLIAVPVLDLPPDRAQQPAWARESRALPLIEAGADWLRSFAPAQFRGGPRRENRADDPQHQVRTLIEVAPKPGAAAEKSGYDARQRDEMDRLMRSQRP
ncbi:MAG: CvpA family protein [Rhodospirillales bacterium]